MENINQSSEVKTKNITLSSVLKWIFGVIFTMVGVTSIFSDFLPGISFLVIGLIFLPPFNKFLKNKFNFVLSRNVKIGIVSILVVLAGATMDTKPKDVSETTPNVTNSQKESNTVTSPVVAEVKPKTLEERISGIINSSLGAQTNTSKPRLISVEVSKYTPSMLSDYGYKSSDDVSSIFIIINADENITTNLQKSTLNKEAFELAKAVFPIDHTIADLIIWEQLPVQDKYGNIKDGTAIVYGISRPLFSKINLDNFFYNDLPNLLRSEIRNDDRNSYFEKITF